MTDAPIKVLLIEDNPGDARLIREMLHEVRSISVDLECADRLRTGLERLAEARIEVVLLDLSLPDAHGLETFVKANALAQGVPVIVLTGTDDETLAVEAVQAGAQDYLVKGQVDSHVLARSMRYAIERKRAGKELREKNLQLQQNTKALENANVALEIAEAKISKEKAKIASLLESLPVGIIMLEEGREISFMNFAAQHLLKVNWQEDKDRRHGKRFLKEQREFDLDALIDSFPRSGQSLWHTELAVQKPQAAMLSVNLVKMSDGDGSAGGILVTLQDVTQERALERMKSEFISNVSHELRTPMTSIKNAINIVLDRTAGELNANQEKFLAIAMRNIDRLARLINDVLDFSKLESGAANLKIQPVDLAKLIDNVFISTQAHAQQKRIALNKKLAPALPKISADSDKVEQVLVNLLNNALKFTPEGGQITIAAESGKVPSGRPPAYRSGRIEARERGEAGHEGVRVSVIDTGVGIAPEHIDSIFDRFKQIEHSRTTKTEGTGLGLSICKKIVELHGGMIGVESAPAAGSKFWFTLPVEGKSHAQNSDR